MSPTFGPNYGFGAYVHWPYCSRICPYCDFNVYASKQRDNRPLLDAIITDIASHKDWLDDHPPLTSIYLGGGTPSLLSGSEVSELITACETSFGVSADAEITLEANPLMVTERLATDWHAAGVNRISLGVQSLTDDALAFLGRDHSADQARKSADVALKTFPSVSLDLIYARPGQTFESWAAELEAATGLGAQHISLYELTIEPGTAFGMAHKRGALHPMPDDAQADLFEFTHDTMEMAGYHAYEISNFARSARHQSHHNLTYWRSGDWIGAGPGAHGRVTVQGHRIATEAERRPEAYIEAVQENGRGAASINTLSVEDAGHEVLAMGLRTVEGVVPERLERLRPGLVDPDRAQELKDDGWLATHPDSLILSPQGRLLADKITAELVG
ncbi:MAG: radical SAM family heme chaperone HemW [Pseudomonadota bacterium]